MNVLLTASIAGTSSLFYNNDGSALQRQKQHLEEQLQKISEDKKMDPQTKQEKIAELQMQIQNLTGDCKTTGGKD